MILFYDISIKLYVEFHLSRGFVVLPHVTVGDVLLNRVPPWHEYHLSVFHAGKLYKHRSLENN